MTHLNGSLAFVLSLSIGCGIDADSLGKAAQSVDRQQAPEQVLCTLDACLIHDLHDSDGDGVSDLDERAAGTDPNDARSRPFIKDLLGKIQDNRLPSFLYGRSMVVVLPTRFPGGTSLFGGREAMPSRSSVLELLGVTMSMLDRIDATHGLTLTNHGTSDRPALGARAMRWGLVGSSDGSPNSTALMMAQRGASTSPVASITMMQISNSGSLQFGSFTMTHDSGSTAEVSYKTSPTKSTVDINRKDEYGTPYGTTHSERTTDPNKHTEEKTTTTTTTECRVGCATQTTTTTTTTNTSADGKTKATDTTRTTTTTSKKGEVTTTTETASTCMGECPTNDDTKTTTCDASTTDCDTNTSTASAFTSPDYVDWAPSPELVRTVLAGLGATILVLNPDGEGPRVVELDPMGKGNKYGPISLVAEEGSTVPLVLHLPDEAQPETDPNLVATELGGIDSGPCTYCGQ